MKYRPNLFFFALMLLSTPGLLLAQDYEYHPTISDNFVAALGAMRSSNSFDLEAEVPGGPGEEIDFGNTLGVSSHSTFFNGQLRWKFGHTRKWSLWGQYFSNNATGNATLTEDVEWDGVTYGEGSFVDAGVKLAVTRLFLGYSFVKNAQNDFGVGFGIHNLDLSAYIKGEFIIDGDTAGSGKKAVGASQILPNIGGWYNYSPAKHWLLHGRVDWISANIGEYDGGLWNASAGVNYQAWRNVGLDLSWQYFNLHVDVTKTNWTGSVNMTYSGPVLALTFAW